MGQYTDLMEYLKTGYLDKSSSKELNNNSNNKTTPKKIYNNYSDLKVAMQKSSDKKYKRLKTKKAGEYY